MSGFSAWFLVGNGGIDYGDYYWGLYRDYYKNPFPRSPLRTREFLKVVSALIPASLPPMLVTFWGVEGSNPSVLNA